MHRRGLPHRRLRRFGGFPNGSGGLGSLRNLRFRGRPGSLLRDRPVFPGNTAEGRDHLVSDDLDDLFALAGHDVADLVDLVDEVTVDEYARQNPPAQQQDKRSDGADMRAQQPRDLDAECPAPSRRATEAPTVGESEAQSQRPEDHDEEEREDRMVHQQRPLADDPHPDQHQHHGNQDAEQSERTIDQHHSQPRPGDAAEVLDLGADQFAVLDRLLQHALVGSPAEKRKEYRGGGEHSHEQQQQTRDPARAVTVGTLHVLSSVGGCRIFGCHFCYA